MKLNIKNIRVGFWRPAREGDGTPLQCSCLENPMDGGAWWAAVHGVAKSRTRLSNFTFTFHFNALEKETATHSSVLAWRIPGMGETGGLPSMGSHRVRHDWSDLAIATAIVTKQPQHAQNYCKQNSKLHALEQRAWSGESDFTSTSQLVLLPLTPLSSPTTWLPMSLLGWEQRQQEGKGKEGFIQLTQI